MSTQPDDLTPFTRALGGVPPHPGSLDRDALLFAAGRASARRNALWPATAAALAVLSGALGVMLAVRAPAVVEVERIVYVPTAAPRAEPGDNPAVPADQAADSSPPATSGNESLSLMEGLRQRQRILSEGMGELSQKPWALPAHSSDDVPDLNSLRLHASHPEGERIR